MFVRIDCSLLSVDEDYKIIGWAMTHFRATVEQIADRGFYICHPCLPRSELCSVDAPSKRRVRGIVAFLARAAAVGGHFDMRAVYRSWLFD
jgi:hypothetical protein